MLRQTRCEYAPLRRFDIVLDPAKIERLCTDVVDDVCRARISIAWLSNGSDVDEIFAPRRYGESLRLYHANARELALVDHGAMRMAMKADGRYLIAEISLRLLDIEYVAETLGPVHRGMHKSDALRYHAERKIMKIFQFLAGKLITRPSDNGSRIRVKILEARSRSNVMIVVALDYRTTERPYDL